MAKIVAIRGKQYMSGWQYMTDERLEDRQTLAEYEQYLKNISDDELVQTFNDITNYIQKHTFSQSAGELIGNALDLVIYELDNRDVKIKLTNAFEVH